MSARRVPLVLVAWRVDPRPRCPTTLVIDAMPSGVAQRWSPVYTRDALFARRAFRTISQREPIHLDEQRSG